jgi:hypothetical protein
MQLIQSVLRCLTGPSGAAVHRSTRHQVIRHIGKIGRHPIHRIAAQTPWGFGSVCRYVAVAVGIGTGAGAPVATSALLPPPIPLSVTGGFRPGNSGRPIGGSSAFGGWVVSDTFGPRDTTTQAPFDSPLQFIVNTLPEADDLPLDVVVARVRDHLSYPILTSTNIPPVAVSVQPVPPNLIVAEPPAFELLLIGVLAILWCRPTAVLARKRLAGVLDRNITGRRC